MTTLIFEIIRYAIFLIIGIFSIRFFEEKKGWDISYKTSLSFNFIWKTIMLFMLIMLDFLMQFLGSVNLLQLGETLIITMIFSYFGDLIFGVLIFKVMYNQKIQDFVIIITIIVLIEVILDNIIFYPLRYFISF